ncbi:NADH:flavin oxidoreductase/NADH oxidase [Paraburkholderia sp. BCC1885]|uniref:NADH:flavin oxidoreductase/NADH oxidase n=1 Tax=Paraburkholderia sp. BCC1885 TaxID=2562669 RepID=UPI00118415F3|nr:NADH:flavin oxidoreductase/NADH oxidase [Paraburkholderia sp. BCC1885]
MTLFEPISLRGVTLRNRLAISPMCQYSAVDGVANDYHLVHLGRFALGGFGLVIVEATGVVPEGRITHGDLGLWSDAQIPALARIVDTLKAAGAAAGIQLAHAGPKASMQRPWFGNGPLGAADFARGDLPWTVYAASAQPVGDGWLTPEALSLAQIAATKAAFVAAARRAHAAGFDVIELHCAHGYLLNSFLSPLTNRRTDQYGGDLEGRMRLPLEIAQALREAWPQDKPLFVRVSTVDGLRAGTTPDDTVAFAKRLKALGVDVVDCSSGGTGNGYEYPVGYGYQVPYASRVRKEAGVASMAVGLIVDAHQAQAIVEDGHADLVAIGREALADPNWALHAQAELGANDPADPFASWPRQTDWWLAGRAKEIAKLDAAVCAVQTAVPSEA